MISANTAMKVATSLFIGLLVTACSLMPPRRQYIKEVKHQIVPEGILNSEWVLETFDNHTSDCNLTIAFLEKGQFTFKVKDELFTGDYLWYQVKDSTIEFHTRPIEKIFWRGFNCEIDPDNFARYLSGEKRIAIEADRKQNATYRIIFESF